MIVLINTNKKTFNNTKQVKIFHAGLNARDAIEQYEDPCSPISELFQEVSPEIKKRAIALLKLHLKNKDRKPVQFIHKNLNVSIDVTFKFF
jgi:hypothetical protein